MSLHPTLDALTVRDDVLIEIATFLSRRWSDKAKTLVTFIEEANPKTNPEKRQIGLPSLRGYPGNRFQKYRQWRVSLWYESMRIKYSTKVLSYDHAYGFIFNALEKKRVESLGLNEWKGMLDEIIFNEGISWLNRPLLNSLYGVQKLLEGFGQLFLTGYIKGELFSSEQYKVGKAVELASSVVEEALAYNYQTRWIEEQVPRIIKILEIDPLVLVPISTLHSRFGISMAQSDLVGQIEKIIKRRSSEKSPERNVKAIVQGPDVLTEYETLIQESRRHENSGYENIGNLGISIPQRLDVNESQVYDLDLVNKIKAKFREWRTGWIEKHDYFGEEFDAESFIEFLPKPFINDVKLTIKARVLILLDHSSSVQEVELKYKQATNALCEALSFLAVRFAVYAFSTEGKQVKCWLIKPPNYRWSSICTKRLAQIRASGGTPLAEIYALLEPVVRSFKPEIFFTLTDGEPSDTDAVRHMVVTFRKIGCQMVALGLGRTMNEAVTIGQNLRYLDYERSLAVSTLEDIPKKVIGLLRS
ncbi:MAG TPA: VWA domain-containing protein [Nitrososphaeraceae archaeon]|nr:VWA domain-containing protein [Nitrososphaeraceae archaeon]